MEFRQQLIINKKLPKPVQKVTGNKFILNFSTEIGFNIDVQDFDDDIFDTASSSAFGKIIIDGKVIFFGCDATLNNKVLPKESIIIGDGIWGTSTPNHIPSPWSMWFWITGTPKKIQPIEKRSGWCCTMSRQKSHRDMVCDILSLKHLELMKKTKYFVYDRNTYDNGFIPKMPTQEQIDRNNEVFTKLQPYMNKDILFENRKKTFYYQPGQWHQECVVELVPETSSECFYVTEKTIKPIASGMPFVSISCYKFLYNLKKLGFKTFHPFIDESYDLEVDQRQRFEMAISAMESFLQTYENHTDEIQKICDHNRMILQKIRKYPFSNQLGKKLRRFITFA